MSPFALLFGAWIAMGPPAVEVPAAVSGPALLHPTRLFDANEVLAARNEEPAARIAHPEGHKDPRLGMLFSLLVPGLGELWLGRPDRAKLFFAAEAGIWTAYGVFRAEGNHRKDLYREYARVNAGVSPRDDDEYYRLIAIYESSDGPFSANEFVRRQARSIYPNDRAEQERFLQENGYFGSDAWQWSGPETQERYNDMRGRSLDAYNRANLTLGLAVANRLISIVDVGILTARRNKSLRDGDASLVWDVAAGPDGPGATLTLARTF